MISCADGEVGALDYQEQGKLLKELFKKKFETFQSYSDWFAYLAANKIILSNSKYYGYGCRPGKNSLKGYQVLYSPDESSHWTDIYGKKAQLETMLVPDELVQKIIVLKDLP